MFGRLFLLFAIIPVIELYLLIEVGGMIGTLNTVIIIVATAAIGAYLTKMEGFIVLNNIRQAGSEGRIPGNELLHGLFVLLGGLTLLTPGFLTDALGFSMIIPGLRKIYVDYAREFIRKKIDNGSWNISAGRF
ncbi:MAG: membrane protein FxsA [Melioribacteraceae bacterium]|nr:MAG: membrane protein FxsA [Melioribacteraceae bacterium]